MIRLISASVRALTVLALLLAIPTASLAQSRAADYPSRPVRLVLPFPPGGTTDSAGRMYANALQGVLKQSVVIENKPGGNLIIGAGDVARSAADGYSLLFSTHSIGYENLLTTDMPFNPQRDLTPVGVIAGSGVVFAVLPSFPAKNWAEFMSYVKANPGKVNQARVGPGLIELADMWSGLGLDMTDVPYKGGAAALTALLSGEVQIYGHSPAETAKLVEQGKLRALAYSDRVRAATRIATGSAFGGRETCPRIWSPASIRRRSTRSNCRNCASVSADSASRSLAERPRRCGRKSAPMPSVWPSCRPRAIHCADAAMRAATVDSIFRRGSSS
jgi:tripartite-type tricarboxylate transporter receptor subunit TctC